MQSSLSSLPQPPAFPLVRENQEKVLKLSIYSFPSPYQLCQTKDVPHADGNNFSCLCKAETTTAKFAILNNTFVVLLHSSTASSLLNVENTISQAFWLK